MTKRRHVQISISQRYLLPVGTMIVFLLLRCGHSGESHANGLPSPTGPPATSPTSSMRLQVGAKRYQPGSTINVTIKNQNQQTISFVDHQTNCTVLLLERLVATSWKPVALCKLMIATRMHTLSAGEILEVKLIAPGQWPIGRYRARFEYRVGSTMGNGVTTIVSSNTFRVGWMARVCQQGDTSSSNSLKRDLSSRLSSQIEPCLKELLSIVGQQREVDSVSALRQHNSDEVDKVGCHQKTPHHTRYFPIPDKS